MVPKNDHVIMITASKSECGNYTLSYHLLDNDNGVTSDYQDTEHGKQLL